MSKISIKKLITHKKTLLLSLMLIISLALGLFVNQKFYHADDTAIASLESTSSLTVVETSDYYAFIPVAEATGSAFILYPGALVDAKAYAPLMAKLAEQGATSFIAKMPLNMAILKKDAARQIIADYPNITDWYIGGHSLGGVMAASYADENPDLIKGIAFLASYPNKDLTDHPLKVVSLYGTNDGVLNMSAYQDAKRLLPTDSANYKEIPLIGGNHAGFGNYGSQSVDATATISSKIQQELTVNALINLMNNN